jgi:tight adherence protein C
MPTFLAVASDERRKRLGDRLVQAGLYRPRSIGYFAFLQILMVALPVGIWLVAAFTGAVTMKQALMYGLLTGLLGVVTPTLWLDMHKRKRQTSLRKALPDALDVIVVCMEAGLSLPAAFVRVSTDLRTVHPMLSTEFVIVQREIQMGASTGEALRRFAERFDLEELRSLSSVVLQAEKFGSSIVKAIRVNADSIRTKRMMGAEEKAQQASVKLMIPTVLFIFPALFVVLLGPAAFSIYETLLPKFYGQ